MVVSTILACFSNNMLIPAYFSVKFCIKHLLNIYKIMTLFTLLSDLQTRISSVILEEGRSLNPPSTPSRLNFTHLPLSFAHHHLSTTTPALALSPPTSPLDLAASPSPLLRDVGSTSTSTAPSQARMQPQPPLPFSKGCGCSFSLDGGIGEGGAEGGTNEMGGPSGVSRKWAMTFVLACFLPSLPPRPSY